MQKDDEESEPPKSRSSSRRNSASLSRRSSLQKEREGKKKSPLNTAPSSVNSTPKKTKQPLDLCITGKPLLKKSDRANSLPGYPRRSADKRRPSEAPKRPQADSRDASLEDDALDLSQVSDFEDTNSKYGIQRKYSAMVTSTPKVTPRGQKGRSTSLHSQLHLQKLETSRRTMKTDSRQSNSTFSCSRDSLYRTSSSSNYRHGLSTDLEYSSVSPEYSGQSSTEVSPRNVTTTELAISPRSQELQLSSCLVSTWQDASDGEPTRGEDCGEWAHFWDSYNASLTAVPMKSYYDQCPTPYRTEQFDPGDLDFSAEGSRKRSPDNFRNLNNIIRNEGLHLTPRETQNIIKCAHILGNVLTKAIERRSKEKDIEEQCCEETVDEKELMKKNLKLDLKETVIPMEVKEEKKSETTQTDISLPNTKSAPKIFEKILRQLSKTSLEENMQKKVVEKENNVEKKDEENSVKKTDEESK